MSSLGKRKAEEERRPNKRARQRELKKVARRISTQSSSKGSTLLNKDDADKTFVKLPNHIQVDKYLASYSYEIQALQNAIKSSSVGSSIRAWQMLPRHKRRRNASHNLLALPKRLREKGKAELKASNTAAQSRSETRRAKGKGDRLALGAYPRRREGSRRRELVDRASKAAQSGKAWMETHLWHAKRFRMSAAGEKLVGGKPIPTADRWGFSLAEEGTMKSYRSSWRDERRGASIMDVSYDVWIRLQASVRASDEEEGVKSALVKILTKAGLESGWQEEWRDGKRCCKTIFTSPESHHVNRSDADGEVQKSSDSGLSILCCNGPVQLMWVQKDDVASSSQRKSSEILLRTHPAAGSTLLRSLHSAVVALSRDLSARVEIQRLNSLPHPSVAAGSGAAGRRHGKHPDKTQSEAKVLNRYLDSLQRKWMKAEAYNTFELGGRMAAELLAKVIRPVNGEDGGKVEALLQGSLVDGTVVPLNVHDPRLSFPPRKPVNKAASAQKPSTDWSPCSRLFTQGCPPPAFRKGDIDRRKSKLTIPGTRLLPTSRDDVVPIVVIAHKKQGEASSLTLLVPRSWGLAFWLSLVHPGTRVLGQVMSHALNFDRGKPTFPFDWAGTSGFSRQEETDSLLSSNEWLRKPPAKRCNVDKVGVRWPFGGRGLWIEAVRHGQRIAGVASAKDNPDSVAPFLFAITSTTSIESLTKLYHSWKRDTTSFPLNNLRLLKSALVSVRLTACRRGSFAKWDEIHFLDKNQQDHWRSALLQVQYDSHSKGVLQKLESQVAPSSQTHIGSVTTGNFTLSHGKVSAFASISLVALLEILTSQQPQEQSNSLAKTRNPIPMDNLILVKGAQTGVHRAASLEVVSLL